MDTIGNSSINSLKTVLVDSLDISALSGTLNFSREYLQGWKNVSLQVQWIGLAGTLDGSLKLQQHNSPGLPWNDIPSLEQSLNTTNGDVILDFTNFLGDGLNLVIDTGNITDGIISAVLILKK